MPSASEPLQTMVQDDDVEEENAPLLDAMPAPTVRMIWVATILIGCILIWCGFDAMNHDVSAQLFALQKYSGAADTSSFDMPRKKAMDLESPLTLAFVQFAFMGVLFLLMWTLLTNNARGELSVLKRSLFGKRWAITALTHVFGTFWLQAMVLPSQMMSIGLFAASRAAEIPVTAALRAHFLGARFRCQSKLLAAGMFASAWTVFYSYTNIAECLCIWSGHGVKLSGVLLYLVYALVLVIPAGNAVCQEIATEKHGTNPFLMLGVQNLLACLICVPLLVMAHCVGWEHVGNAVHMMTTRADMAMLVLSLCLQMSVTSAMGVAIISLLDSFWAVTVHSLRVVVWWYKELLLFVFFSKVSLSIARPHAAVWTFAMSLGVMGVLCFFVMDYHESAMWIEKKASSKAQSASKGPGYRSV